MSRRNSATLATPGAPRWLSPAAGHFFPRPRSTARRWRAERHPRGRQRAGLTRSLVRSAPAIVHNATDAPERRRDYLDDQFFLSRREHDNWQTDDTRARTACLVQGL